MKAILAPLALALLPHAPDASSPQVGAAGASAPARTLPDDGHAGPEVAPAEDGAGPRGPARYVPALLAGFDIAAALSDTTYIDGFYRTPASPLYDLCLGRLADTLRRAGFGQKEGLTLRFIEGAEPFKAWWPESGLLEFRPVAGAPAEILLAFASPADAHRTMLPVGAPSADVEGEFTFATDESEGKILVTRAPLSRVTVGRAQARGALAVLSASVFPFTEDPSGGDRHLDAIQFASAPKGTNLPVAQISARVFEQLEAAPPGARLRLVARTHTAERTERTLVAEVVGARVPEEAVVIASHLQEPGAGDNAAGTAGLAATAVALAGAIERGELARPARTLVLVFGDEHRQSSIWLDEGSRRAVAALSADMLGQSQERTGSIALLERSPDPGALFTLAPDAHTEWGAKALDPSHVVPNGLNVVCREAFADVAAAVGGWRTSENPWEGGSDHDIFNGRGIPATLMWHFTDFTYHTSLDRMEMIDGEELRRTCAAIVAAALAVASMDARDLERHLESNEFERELRVRAALAANHAAAEKAWLEWCDGADEWLRRTTLR